MPAIFLKSAFKPADIPESDKPQIALLGRSNVGKSSLINHLAGVKNLARVSATPGLTQAINFYEFDGRYLLVDLPGYGFSIAARSRGKGFEEMIGDYLSEAKQLKLVLLIIDGRRGLQDSDRYALDQLQGQEVPHTIVFNKVDKVSNSEAALSMRRIRDEYPGLTCISHSTAGSTGLGELRDAIERAVREAAT
jgi:GTP-binding protein